MPDPDGPITAVKLPRSSPSCHAVQRNDGTVAAAVDLFYLIEAHGLGQLRFVLNDLSSHALNVAVAKAL